MSYSARLQAPSTSNKYFYANNIFYQCGYGLPNCTCYAWGRFYEISGERPKLSTSNAENWWNHNDGYERGKTPRLGAVICWSKGKVGVGSDGAGHVGIVEKIYSDGSILVGQSGWGAKSRFWTTKVSKGYALSGYKFQGFIYNPAVKVVTPKVLYRCVVTSTTLNKRTGPGTSYSLLGQFKKGTICRIIEVSADKKWGKTYNGYWISLQYTSKIVARRRTTSTVNIRKGPGTDNAIVGKVSKGVLCNFVKLSEDKKWGKLSNGKGWVSLAYTKKL